MKRKIWAFISIVTAILLITALSTYATASRQAKWSLRGTNAIIVGGYGDNFDYGGVNTRAIEGDIKIEVNADKDVGAVIVKIRGTINPADGLTLDGEIKLVMTRFEGPAPFMQGGIVENIVLHGTTGQGPPLMPKVQTFLGGWGTADVYLDDVLVREGLDAHFMYTDGARDEDHKIWLDEEKTTIFPGMEYMMWVMTGGDMGLPPQDGYVDLDDRELHIVAHSTVEDSNNFPQHDFWIHLNFEGVEVKSAPSGAAV